MKALIFRYILVLSKTNGFIYMKKQIIFIMATLFLMSAWADSGLEARLNQQYQVSFEWMLKNLPQDPDRLGSVAASPTKEYQYHWSRDAALTHQALFEVFQKTHQIQIKNKILKVFQKWVLFEKKAVRNAIESGLGPGEPKFQLDGQIFKGEWGRPQNDGPAVRSLVMSLWALELIKLGQKDWVLRHLYRPELPSNTSLIKLDLDFTAQNWEAPSFDLWEEIKGLNFYTLALQRKSLLIGAQLAKELDDPFAAKFYLEKAQLILNKMNLFYSSQAGYIVAIQNQVDGWTHKKSNLDVSVILGTIQGFLDLGFLNSQGPQVLQTAQKIENTFSSLYPINQNKKVPVIGRYSEDVYDGFGFTGGNPWFIATHAHAELNCKWARFNPRTASAFQKKGLLFLARSLEHVNQQTGEMSEQISRVNGYLTGVSHLTWSYASFITAYHACLGI